MASAACASSRLVRAEHSVVLAHVSHDSTDLVLEHLRALGVSRTDLTLTRVEELGGGFTSTEATSLIWADVVGLAGSNARLIGRYLAFMGVAGSDRLLRGHRDERDPDRRGDGCQPRPAPDHRDRGGADRPLAGGSSPVRC